MKSKGCGKPEGIRKLLWIPGSLCLAAVVCVLAVAGIKSSRPDVPSVQPAERKRRTPARIPRPDSGDSLAYTVLSRTPHDPTSLQSIRAAFQNLGYRGIAALRLQSTPSPRHKLDQLLQIALLYGYEGDFVKAGATLDAARSLADDNPLGFVAELPTVIFLQGLMALRRGEVENCVECPCQGSCIFPLQSNAVHQKRDRIAPGRQVFP